MYEFVSNVRQKFFRKEAFNVFKKLFALAFGLTIAFSASAMAAGNGDVTGDGEVNIVDASFVLQYSRGLRDSLPNKENADVNGDGFIDQADADGILNIIRNGKIFNQYNKIATQKTLAYANYQLNQRHGNEWVDAGDNVTVLQEYENAYFVRYPVRNGYKERWVNKNEIFSGGNPTPNPTPSGDYNAKIHQFINHDWYKNDSQWGWDCAAYANEFTNFVFGKDRTAGRLFINANEIQAGDVVHLVGSPNHFFVVLARNGNNLTTIEGNYSKIKDRRNPKNNNRYGKTVYSTTAYTVVNGQVLRNGKESKSFDYGHHFL